MNKLEFINTYIEKCQIVILSQNVMDAKKLQDEIIGVFETEISDIKNMLDNYGWHYEENRKVDFIGDINLIKQKLINYATNIQQKQKDMEYELELARLKQPQVSAHAEAKPTQTANLTSNVTISIEQVINKLDEISEDNLSKADKEILKEHLYSLEGAKVAKDKEKFWDKGKEILRFVADKGADAAIAALPLIIAGL